MFAIRASDVTRAADATARRGMQAPLEDPFPARAGIATAASPGSPTRRTVRSARRRRAYRSLGATAGRMRSTSAAARAIAAS